MENKEIDKKLYCELSDNIEIKDLEKVYIEGSLLYIVYSKNSNVVSPNKTEEGLYYDTQSINDYAHECKKWATTKDYYLTSRYIRDHSKKVLYSRCIITYDDGKSENDKWWTIADNESESTIKASQYIIDNYL